VLVQPVVTVEEEELLAPKHAGDGLAHHVDGVRGDRSKGPRSGRTHPPPAAGRPEFCQTPHRSRMGWFGFPTLSGSGLAVHAQPHGHRLSRSNRHPIVRRSLGTLLFRVHCALIALYHAVVDAVLDVGALVLLPGEKALVSRCIICEEQWHLAFARKDELSPANGLPQPALAPAASIRLRFGFLAALLDSAIHEAQSFRNHRVGRRWPEARRIA
jgi:hypothetical protein